MRELEIQTLFQTLVQSQKDKIESHVEHHSFSTHLI